jgi:enolase
MAYLIREITSWEALDSRGNPTVAVSVETETGGRGQALAPAGASAGGHEAKFIRDNSDHYSGLSVRQVIARSLPLIRAACIGIDADNPEALYQALRSIDVTDDWSQLGGNVTTAFTIAAWLAVADSQNRAPWRVIADWTGSSPSLPVPMVNIVSGGAHAARAVDIQDVLVAPVSATTVEEAIENVWKVRKGASQVMNEHGFASALVADEGGLAGDFANSEFALKVVVDGIHKAGLALGADAALALDIAANQFHSSGSQYVFEGHTLASSELIEIFLGWARKWPIASVEDPLAEDDDWSIAAPLLSSTCIVGDDRYATSLGRLARGIEQKEANSVLIKPNQAGTLWQTISAVSLAKKADWATIVSARSGDTEEQWLVDLAVGTDAGQIKVGSTMRSERTAKWNRMLELSAQNQIPYAGAKER